MLTQSQKPLKPNYMLRKTINRIDHPDFQGSIVRTELAVLMQGICLFSGLFFLSSFMCWYDTCPCIDHLSGFYSIPLFIMGMGFSIRDDFWKATVVVIGGIVLMIALHHHGCSIPCLNCIHNVK